MAERNVHKKEQGFKGNIAYWAAGVLVVLTLISVCLVSGMFARYTVTTNRITSARVAGTGIGTLEFLEREAKETYENSGIYELLEKSSTNSNTYDKVLPGVDIPKDPYVHLVFNNKAEVDYDLYIQITENNFPTYVDPVTGETKKAVTYDVNDKWKIVEEESNPKKGIYVYKYVDVIGANTNTPEEIYVLLNNKLIVSEHFVGNGKFSLTFSGWLKQRN